jgi:hypothetical protein
MQMTSMGVVAHAAASLTFIGQCKTVEVCWYRLLYPPKCCALNSTACECELSSCSCISSCVR